MKVNNFPPIQPLPDPGEIFPTNNHAARILPLLLVIYLDKVISSPCLKALTLPDSLPTHPTPPQANVQRKNLTLWQKILYNLKSLLLISGPSLLHTLSSWPTKPLEVLWRGHNLSRIGASLCLVLFSSLSYWTPIFYSFSLLSQFTFSALCQGSHSNLSIFFS